MNLFNRNRIDPVGIGAINEEQIDLALVASLNDLTGVASDADSVELDDTLAQSARLALHANKLITLIQHQVVALVHSEGKQDAVAAAHQLTRDVGLGAETDINRM